MAALLDHADSDGLLRDSGAGIPRPCTAMGCCVLSGEVQRGVAYGLACGAPLRWGSRCVEVTQRAVLPAEEESQRETASDTP